MRAVDVVRRIRRGGGDLVRQVGSHARYRVIVGETRCETAVPMHPGDIPTGTLHKIEKDLEPALGAGWLIRRK